MKKYLNVNVFVFALFITIICFFLFSFSFHLEHYRLYEGELGDEYRGFGFPFIWYTNNIGTSLNTFVNPLFLLIDFLFYYIVILFLLIGGLRLFNIKKPKPKKLKILFWVLLIASIMVLIGTYLFTFLFASVDFSFEEAIYSTIKFSLGPPAYFI